MHQTEDASNAALEAELQRIQTMSLSELRTTWTARWGFAPVFRSVDFLRRLVAWRIQAEVFGGLDAETKDWLGRTRLPPAPRPPPGSRLTREYLGVLHHVEVGEDTFTYRGASYGS